MNGAWRSVAQQVRLSLNETSVRGLKEAYVSLMVVPCAGDWGTTDDDDAVHARISAALDKAVDKFGPTVAELVAAARNGMVELLTAMDAASLEDGCAGDD
jgi:hypothetical protein